MSDFCPTQQQLLPQALAVLPRGRAWGTHEGGAAPGSVLYRFWSAIAAVLGFAHARICALREEFWCATQSETRDLWLAEYGLPDACDPFPDLCTKVAAVGGTTCAYFQAIAARAGWSIACAADLSDRAGCFMAGCSLPGPADAPGLLRIQVTLAASPSYGGPGQQQFLAGCGMAGEPLGCGPDISPLQCLLARILPAHAAVVYEVI